MEEDITDCTVQTVQPIKKKYLRSKTQHNTAHHVATLEYKTHTYTACKPCCGKTTMMTMPDNGNDDDGDVLFRAAVDCLHVSCQWQGQLQRWIEYQALMRIMMMMMMVVVLL